MPILCNARHERFAQLVAAGRSAGNAYVEAGYDCARHKARGHGHRLRTREDVQARIGELLGTQQKIVQEATEQAIEKTAIGKVWVLEHLREVVERAMQQRPVLDHEGRPTGEYRYDGNVANRALELIGRELGMFIKREEHGRPGEFANMTDEALRRDLIQMLTARGMTERQAERFLDAREAPPIEGEASEVKG